MISVLFGLLIFITGINCVIHGSASGLQIFILLAGVISFRIFKVGNIELVNFAFVRYSLMLTYNIIFYDEIKLYFTEE